MELNPLRTTRTADSVSEKGSKVPIVLPGAMAFMDEYVFGRYHPFIPILWGAFFTSLGIGLVYISAESFYLDDDKSEFLSHAVDQVYYLSLVACVLFNLYFGYSVLARNRLVHKTLTIIAAENNVEDAVKANNQLISILSRGFVFVELILCIFPYTLYFAISFRDDRTKYIFQIIFFVLSDILNTYIMLLWVWLNLSAKIVSDFAIDNKMNVASMNNRSALLAFFHVSDEMNTMTEGWTANNIMRLLFGIYWVFYFFVKGNEILEIPYYEWDKDTVVLLVFVVSEIVFRFAALVILAAAPGYINGSHISKGRKKAKYLMRDEECDSREVLSFMSISESVADEDGMLYCGVPMTLEKVSYIFTALGILISSSATSLHSTS